MKALRRLAAKLDVTAEYLETGSDLTAAAARELRLGDLELAVRLGADAGAAEALEEVLQEALDAGDRPAALRARAALAQLAAEAGDDTRAAQLLEDALADEPFLPAERFELYASLGRSYARAGRPERAVELFERCLETLDADADLETRYLLLLGYALTDMGELERAGEVVRAGLARAADTDDPYMRVRLHWSSARLAHSRGEDTAALADVRRAIALLQATDDTLHLGRAHVLAAGIAAARGDAETAGEHVAAAERLLGPRPMPSDAFELERHRARVALLLGDADVAAVHARAALALATTPGDEGEARFVLADALAAVGDPVAADSYARAVALLEQGGRRRSAAAAREAARAAR